MDLQLILPKKIHLVQRAVRRRELVKEEAGLTHPILKISLRMPIPLMINPTIAHLITLPVSNPRTD